VSAALLVDTDPGVDDALAILMAHALGDVAGLCIAAGNVGLAHTVGNALKLVEVLGADTPVFAGCAQPLVQAGLDAAFVHGTDGFGDSGYLPARRAVADEHAAAAIVRLARERSGELTLVALAPLTNLALALRLDPELPSHIARLVVMGGAVNGHGNLPQRPMTEFNIGFDPEAAHVVFSGWPLFDLVDWELCMRHAIAFERYDALVEAATGPARLYRAISRKARAFNQAHARAGMVTADALAMALAIDVGLATRCEMRHVGIEREGHLTRGATVVDRDGRLGLAPNARIVMEVDQARFEAMVAAALGVPG
jgi:inosine-uridine nucleoside N-ribohydrolase